MPDVTAPPAGIDPDRTVRDFHRLYYYSAERTLRATRWLGARVIKCPLDLWVYQELLYETRPDVIVETGSGRGGSAFFLASILDLLGGAGRVITIDVRDVERPRHERITYLLGSSTAPEIVDEVRSSFTDGERVMVILDSDHSKEHVLGELRAYAPLVAPGGYLIVEDTNVNGHPVEPDHGPGPMEAVEQFLRDGIGREFSVDRSCEKFLLTMHPGGFLRRAGGDGAS